MEKRRGFAAWFGRKDTIPQKQEALIPFKEAVKPAQNIAKIGWSYAKGTKARDLFEGPEGFTFTEIERAWISDSYVRQAVDKHVDFMFKAGWEFVGKNQASVDYVRQRFAAMAFATGIPTDSLFHQLAENAVKFHNGFVIKARQPGAYQYPQGLKVTSILATKPVAGYFLLPAATITITRTETGDVKLYRQDMKGTGASATKIIDYKPSEIIHLAIDRLDGRAYGYPFLASALPDIMLLRQIEELVDRMIYKNVFPLLKYTIGSKEIPGTDDEIAATKTTLGELTLDGAVITSERHVIELIGAEGKALDVSEYMTYFKTRAFTSLGVSSTIMGESDTSNRSTSDNLDQMFKDRVKGYQKEIEQTVTYQMVYEVLTEGGFDPITNPLDMVEFKFQEIDLAAKMAEQNHIVQMFTQNAISHEQMRTGLKMDPIAPEEEARLYFNMITIPVNKSTSTDIGTQSQDAANSAGATKNQPTNQYGTKNTAESTLFSKIIHKTLVSRYSLFMGGFSDISTSVSKETMAVHASLFRNQAIQTLTTSLETEIANGILALEKQSGRTIRNSAILQSAAKIVLSSKIQGLFSRFTTDLVSRFDSPKTPNETMAILDAFQHRIAAIERTEAMTAYNLGFRHAALSLGIRRASVETSEYECEQCGIFDREINLETDEIPPHHTNCTCRLKL